MLLADAVDLDGELLEVARDANRPALVAEVALELAEDRRARRRRRTRSRARDRSARSPSAGRARRPGSGRRAARRRAGSGARAGVRAAGSARRAPRAPPGPPRGGSARAAAGPRARARPGPSRPANSPDHWTHPNMLRGLRPPRQLDLRWTPTPCLSRFTYVESGTPDCWGARKVAAAGGLGRTGRHSNAGRGGIKGSATDGDGVEPPRARRRRGRGRAAKACARRSRGSATRSSRSPCRCARRRS